MKYTIIQHPKKFKQHQILKSGKEKTTRKQMWRCKQCHIESANMKVFHLKCKETK